MGKWRWLLGPILLASLLPALPVNRYRFFTGLGQASAGAAHARWVVLREACLEGGTYYLAVDPDTLSTALLPSKALSVEPLPLEAIAGRLADTVYIRARRDDLARARALQDAGITRFSPRQPGIDLTVDLCPSSRPLDRRLFAELFKRFGRIEKPVPVAISLSGLWLEEHGTDLGWLREQERRGLISVTWINHSYHHYVSRKLPLKRNFLLESGTDIDFEVLQTERRMLELGILPSVFFRFPGLVSDEVVFDRIVEFGLIPVGSDAWLAKNQWPTPGSIVLVHANGNEPIGIRRFLQLVRRRRLQIQHNQWRLFDLRDSLDAMEARR